MHHRTVTLSSSLCADFEPEVGSLPRGCGYFDLAAAQHMIRRLRHLQHHEVGDRGIVAFVTDGKVAARGKGGRVILVEMNHLFRIGAGIECGERYERCGVVERRHDTDGHRASRS